MVTETHDRPATRPLWRSAALLALSLSLSGCYLLHLADGQLQLMSRRQPVARVIDAPATPAALRARLTTAQAARQFASDVLGLPDNGSYRSYVDVGRPYVTWNVIAARPDSVEPKQWCFPIAGCVAYRGYFDERRARRYAAGLERRGYEVWVGPVPAYSTLGRLRDPLLSTMLRYADVDVAALIFHELAHQLLYVQDDSAFNEAFATAVEYEGVRRWLEAQGRGGELERFEAARRHQFEIADLMVATRARLRALYARRLAAAERDAARAAEFARLRADYAALRARSGAGTGDPFAADPVLNNARLAAFATYHQCLPGLERELARVGRDLPAFYAAARDLARLPAAERAARVCAAGATPPAS
jgi:predicted aminopeptidase